MTALPARSAPSSDVLSDRDAVRRSVSGTSELIPLAPEERRDFRSSTSAAGVRWSPARRAFCVESFWPRSSLQARPHALDLDEGQLAIIAENRCDRRGL